MKILSASAAVVVISFTAFNTSLFIKNSSNNTKISPVTVEQKIQAAILLDVSGSMGGLIEQAKAQLWNMVSVMGKAKCESGNPKIEIALYEYGRSANGVKTGYIKQISAFSSDLDQLSQELFKLSINGSEEYCGQVIYTSLNELNWDPSPSSYKVIFIAGNEDFLQGSIHYTKACEIAKKTGVIVNTIYCGDRLQGIREHWDLAGECGDGSFTNINQDAKIEDILTPYDSVLVVLNSKLNNTYIGYGSLAGQGYMSQSNADIQNLQMSKPVAAKRAEVKANKQLYNNSAWDLVDAYDADSSGFIKKIDMKTLPDSLKNKSKEELEKVITIKAGERAAIQKEIQAISLQRNNYISAEKAKAASGNNSPTLETEIEKIIKSQVKRFNMKFE